MFANLLVFLLVIGLAVLFGWLCYKSIRAKKLWVKIVGGIGFAVLTLFVLFIAFNGGKGIAVDLLPRRIRRACADRGRHAGADRPRRVSGQRFLRRLSQRDGCQRHSRPGRIR